MKKISLIIILGAIMVSGVFAQNIFFPTKEGLTLLYANLNDKGKADSYTRQIIRKVEGSGSNFTIDYDAQVLDKNRQPISDMPVDVPYTVKISNGVLELDMKSFAAAGTENFIEITGDKLRIPSTLSTGDKLDDVHFILTVNMGFKIKTEISLTEQQCLAIEDIEVTAGRFRCHQITQTNTAKVMGKTVVTKTISWYAPNIGTVKTEVYNDKGKLQNTIELQIVE
jgi:hypothetical protein